MGDGGFSSPQEGSDLIRVTSQKCSGGQYNPPVNLFANTNFAPNSRRCVTGCLRLVYRVDGSVERKGILLLSTGN